uniref:Uncharacterized protein n=1 Tax=Ananas comosus var. bracteatus TaxID=296719 RepID=A0A6V7NS96_ANACO|nr:unnamed protein product [Ananas comosus var. bracteatus]
MECGGHAQVQGANERLLRGRSGRHAGVRHHEAGDVRACGAVGGRAARAHRQLHRGDAGGQQGQPGGPRVVPTEDAVAFAEEQGLFISEASALSGENVGRAFLRLLEEIFAVVSRMLKIRSNSQGAGAGRGQEGHERGINGDGVATVLQGTKVSVLSEASLMETSAMKRATQCGCSL